MLPNLRDNVGLFARRSELIFALFKCTSIYSHNHYKKQSICRYLTFIGDWKLGAITKIDHLQIYLFSKLLLAMKKSKLWELYTS